MEPRPLGRGMLLRRQVRRLEITASMEPRPLGRGMFVPTGRTSRAPTCFNGATTSRSWNARMAGEVDAQRDQRFNGATTSRSWNARRRREASLAAPASMEPRPLGRGMTPSSRRRAQNGIGFNGATTSRSWNEARTRILRQHGSCRFNGATTSRSWNAVWRWPVRCQRGASMEPRPLGRGMGLGHGTSGPR